MYRVIVERSAEKDLRRLPLDVRLRIAHALRNLADDPRPVGCRKLTGTKHDRRIRVGDYRVIYEIVDPLKVLRVYRIRHRREVYR
jgi:mRNA interferase RelE/StbE